MVEVIIPAYNANETIESSLDSILKQTVVKEIKVYVIDDCSNKPYDEIIEKYKGSLDITLVRLEKNSGPGYARQYGLDHSNSKYVMFLDSDDFFTDDNAVEELINIMECNDFDAVSALMNEDYFGKISTYFVGFDTLHAKIYRREFLNKCNIKFPNYYNSEDVAFNNMVLLNTDRIGKIDVNAYTYKRRDNSLTQDNYSSDKHIRCLCENLKYVLNYAEENKIDKKYISAFLRANYSYFMWYFGGRIDKNPAVKYLCDLINDYYKYEKYYVENTGSYWLNFWTIGLRESFSDEEFYRFMEEIKNMSN